MMNIQEKLNRIESDLQSLREALKQTNQPYEIRRKRFFEKYPHAPEDTQGVIENGITTPVFYKMVEGVLYASTFHNSGWDISVYPKGYLDEEMEWI